MAKQYGFYFDTDRCVQCRTCEVACKSIHGNEPGLTRRKIADVWQGDFPNTTRPFFSLACMHCEKPACVEACPTGTISKRTEDGIVVVEGDRCDGCQVCFDACPYDVPRFDSDGLMQKCDFCIESGIDPACAVHCPTDALCYGTMEELSRLAAEKGAQRLAGPTGPSIFVSNRSDTDTILHSTLATE
ncbi:MAG: 4Fe-4S dicluster domain-containing protein [Dehalococcoidia bacterium]